MFDEFKRYISERAILTDQEFEAIKAVSTLKKIRKRQYLLQEGEVWGYYGFVGKGCLRMYQVDAHGVEHIMRFALENWWTGDRESLATGAPSNYQVEALEDSELLLWKRADFEKLLTEIPALKEVIDQLNTASFNASQSRINDLITLTAEERYHRFINQYPSIANRVPLHMVASYLGITAVTLSRIRSQVGKK